MNNYLVVTALGENRIALVGELTGAVLESKCSVVDSRMTTLGQSFGVIMLIAGSWNTLAKLELQLEKLATSHDLLINVQRTQRPPPREDVLPYAVEVIALDQPGIVYRLADFFATRNICIEDLANRSYRANHTDAPMNVVNLIIGIPSDVHIAMLREEFMDFCDQFNWDAVLEPVKA